MKKHLLLIALFVLGVALAPMTISAQNNRHGRRSKSLRDVGPAAAQKAVAADSQSENEVAIHFGAKFLRFDVSENAKRFIFDETPLDEDGLPAYANEFITEGYIYPYGTLTVNEDGQVSGVNEDGSPEFPDKVIGRWTCRGWHTGEGAKTVTGPWVITHQLYDFGDKPGSVTLTTDGLELVDIGVPIERAIIGGTGPYTKARGEAVQTMLGFNQLGGVGLRFVVKVTK
ncbi:MAG: hypothetical protein M3430_03630 [Acidobacteriota bacterium]|nr:hypothetical protein [Acidobacteriota bacterium]